MALAIDHSGHPDLFGNESSCCHSYNPLLWFTRDVIPLVRVLGPLKLSIAEVVDDGLCLLLLVELDLDVDTRGQIQLHQRVDGLLLGL